MSVAEKMTAIANAIRNKTGKTDKLSLDEMATEINEISTGERDINPEWTNWNYFCSYRYDLVSKVKYSDTSKGTDFTGMYMSLGRYMQGGGYVNITSLPLIDTSNGRTFNQMYQDCTKLLSIPAINTSKGTSFNSMFASCQALTSIPQFDTSNGTNFNSMFYYCSALTSIPQFDTSNGTNFGSMFYSCSALTSIPQLNLTKATYSSYVSSMFYNCTALVDLNIVGTINVTGLSVQYSNSLSHDSLMSIINALADKTGVSGTWKVTLGAINLAKLTADEIAIAEGKGWTLA